MIGSSNSPTSSHDDVHDVDVDVHDADDDDDHHHHGNDDDDDDAKEK
ncbi:MAG: hypothetical protein ACI8RD_009559, partial [Bacillariaceae sp.]